MQNLFGVLLFLTLANPAPAADGDWQPLLTDLLKSEKTGFGGLCGVLVDHESGDLWVNLSDRGMYQSRDQGKTWQRVSANQPTGRTETPGCWLFDPTGSSSEMVTALVYGSPLALSADRAATWTYRNQRTSHCDWCAVDWTDAKHKFILALKHESGGLLLASQDGGKSFVEVGKGLGSGWVFDGRTAVIAKVASKETPRPYLVRTADGGKTFERCGDYSPVGRNSGQALPKWHKGTLYWLVEEGLIATSDQGKTWKKVGTLKDTHYGPIFGKDAQELFVLTKAGVLGSKNGGVSWSNLLLPPKDMKGTGGLSWLEYDPKNKVFYLMKMGTNLYRAQSPREKREPQ
jgi:hypothetical protein